MSTGAVVKPVESADIAALRLEVELLRGSLAYLQGRAESVLAADDNMFTGRQLAESILCEVRIAAERGRP